MPAAGVVAISRKSEWIVCNLSPWQLIRDLYFEGLACPGRKHRAVVDTARPQERESRVPCVGKSTARYDRERVAEAEK
jgi:hypothetical protein